MALVKTKVSTVVSKQLPEFVREDNAQFVAFLEAYYEFLGQTEKRNLESIRDIDDTVDGFIQYFKDELLEQIPKNVLSDKRYLAKQIKELYRSKGTIKSYEFLFRLLFNETPDLYFPKVDMLRVSDGKWDQRSVIRTIQISGEAFNLVGQTISQGSSRASVESVIKFQVGTETIIEITVNEQSIVGTFNITDVITGYDNIDGSVITLQVIPVITDFEIINSGGYYDVGSPMYIVSGTGTDAQAEVQSIGYGSITDIIIDTPGSGYSVGTEVTFNNANCGDTGDSLISARAVVTDIDLDSILMEDGSYILQEDRSQFDIETATTGGIRAVKLITGGAYYKRLPVISVSGGTGAKLLVVGDGVGRVTRIGITNPGVGYQTSPIGIFPHNIIVKNITGTFAAGDTITILPQTLSVETNVEDNLILESGDNILLENQQSPEATLYSFNLDKQQLTLYPSTDRITFITEDNNYLMDEEGKNFVNEDSGEFRINQTITSSGGATATIVSDSVRTHAESRGIVGALGKTLGKFINADGKISESSKKIQDSLYYQEYSYVIKVGQSIDKYREAVKKLLHPVGLALFGEVRVQSLINATSSVVLEISDLLRIIRLFIDMKMHAVGNYRTPYEDNSALDKEQVTLIITDFVASCLQLITTTSEFLPTLNFPNLTPAEVHLLDLRTELSESFKSIIFELYTSTAIPKDTAVVENIANLLLRSQPSAGTRVFGTNLGWLEKWKFTIPPYASGSKNTIGVYTDAWNQNYTGTNNQGYWDYFANTQIKDFADVIIADVINNPNRRTNFAQEAYIDIIRIDGTYSFDSFDSTETMDSDAITMDSQATFDSTESLTLDSTSILMDSM